MRRWAASRPVSGGAGIGVVTGAVCRRPPGWRPGCSGRTRPGRGFEGAAWAVMVVSGLPALVAQGKSTSLLKKVSQVRILPGARTKPTVNSGYAPLSGVRSWPGVDKHHRAQVARRTDDAVPQAGADLVRGAAGRSGRDDTGPDHRRDQPRPARGLPAPALPRHHSPRPAPSPSLRRDPHERHRGRWQRRARVRVGSHRHRPPRGGLHCERPGEGAPTAAPTRGLHSATASCPSRGGRYALTDEVPPGLSCNTSKCTDEVTVWLRRRRFDERAFLLRHVQIRADPEMVFVES